MGKIAVETGAAAGANATARTGAGLATAEAAAEARIETSITFEGFSFTYPHALSPALSNINLNIKQGEFLVLCGPSGGGKTTLLRSCKPLLAPFGTKSGRILLGTTALENLSEYVATATIGFVRQSPENQIITDKVWHELAFGLESLGYDNATIRLRVAEMASYFGIQDWFYRSTSELSGGQKQLLALASVMVMQPSVLLLDEPTSQLDPIAASEFLATLAKINRELGTTIILTEHRLEEAFCLCDRAVVLEEGRILCEGTPQQVAEQLRTTNHGMFLAMPAPMRIWAGVENTLPCPLTVREGREWISQFDVKNPLPARKSARPHQDTANETPAIELKNLWFKYGKDYPDVIKDLSFSAYAGEITTILGGNGTGKTTALSLIAGIYQPYRGTVKIQGQPLSEIPKGKLFDHCLAVLPQNPQTLFVGKTVEEDLREMLDGRSLSKRERQQQLDEVVQLCLLTELLQSHPYDLSAGQQQRLALAKVLLLQPKILLLDEPTKGLDAQFKQTLADILRTLAASGVAVVAVSHDLEFCARCADQCALFFDGEIVSQALPREFFSGKSFYTSATNRMARHVLPEAIVVEDVIVALGGVALGGTDGQQSVFDGFDTPQPAAPKSDAPSSVASRNPDAPRNPVAPRPDAPNNPDEPRNPDASNNPDVLEPQKSSRSPKPQAFTKRTLLAALFVLIAVPLTLYFGMTFFGDRKFYYLSLLIILEALLPFILAFEGRKPLARELVILAVLIALAVVGRAAFFMVPQFKPVVALVIISGVAFGAESGFLVGVLTAFVSNMFFGQGPWTPWQMFALGIIGFLAGILFRKGALPRARTVLCIFGALVTLVIYGGFMVPASVLMFMPEPNLPLFILAYVQALPFDVIHALATVVFLALLARPLLEKLDRVKQKYGLLKTA